MSISNLAYSFPQAAYLLLFVPFIFVFSWILFQAKERVLDLFPGEKLKQLLTVQTPLNYWLKVFGLAFAWILLTLALMQPKGNAHYPKQLANQDQNQMRLQPHEVIFFIDDSASMGVKDGRVRQSRLENAKEIVDQVISELRGQSASLYSFTSDVSKLSPPSMDYLFMRMMLRNLSINQGDMTGTDFKAMLQYFQENYLATETPLIKTVIILSDGEDNQLQDLQGSARDSYIQSLTSLLGENVEKEKLHLFTVGLGTLEGGNVPDLKDQGQVVSKLNEPLLKALSQKGRGVYYPAREIPSLNIATDLSKKISEEDVYAKVALSKELNPQEDLIYDLYFQYPLGLALILLAFTFFWPKTSLLRHTALFFMFIHSTQAADRENPLDQAIMYYEANAYVGSDKLLKNLLETSKSSWENAVLKYNLGTSLIAQQEYQKGMDLLRSVFLDTNSSPLLIYYLQNNLSVAYFQQAEALKKELLNSKSSDQESFFKTIFNYKKASEESIKAQNAGCHVQQIIGENKCPEDFNLKAIEDLSMEYQAETYNQARKNLIKEADLKQGVPWAYAGFKLVEKDFNFYQDLASTSPLRNDYQHFILEQVQSWQSLLEALESKNKEQKELGVIKNQYAQMLGEIKDNDFSKAEISLKKILGDLSQVMKKIYSNNPFKETLSKIESEFNMISLEDPLDLESLLFLQQELNGIALSKGQEVYKVGLEAIKDNLERSVANVTKQSVILARIYYNESYQQLKRLSLVTTSNVQENPILILEASIGEQNHALDQMRLFSQLINPDREVVEIAYKFALSAQEYLNSYITYFYSASYAQQVNLFAEDVPEGKEDERCQFHPWNEAFPVFQEGSVAADRAVQLLKAKNLDVNLVMNQQESVIEKWKETLNILKAPPQKGGCQGEPQSNISPTQIESTNFDNSTRLIQYMNQEDQKVPQQGVLKPGKYAW